MLLESKTYNLDQMPTAVWVPADNAWFVETSVESFPDCYQGTPVEIFEQFKEGHYPELELEEVLYSLSDEFDIELPSETPLEQRAAIILAVMLTTGLVREMPRS